VSVNELNASEPMMKLRKGK